MTDVVLSGVGKSYALPGGERRTALRGVDLHVRAGEFVAVLGPSGCGKTTLLNVLAGLDDDYVGRVTRSGDDGRPGRVSYMFQEPRLLPWMSVADNLAFVLDTPREERRRTVERWLARVGLEGRGRDYPYQLSVGMQQRVAVARALMIEPHLLLLDEPFSSLDELTALGMRRELLELWSGLRCTVVFVTHNPLEAAYLADRVVVMASGPGRIVAEMDVRERLPRPRASDDPALWTVSREAIALLRGGDVDPSAAPAGSLETPRPSAP